MHKGSKGKYARSTAAGTPTKLTTWLYCGLLVTGLWFVMRLLNGPAPSLAPGFVYEERVERVEPVSPLETASALNVDVLSKASLLASNLRGGAGVAPVPVPVAVVEEFSTALTPAPLVLLSRQPGVTAQADVRGNLGPISVVLQAQPGKDWLKDRWQAASDMGGTAIPGVHWVVLDLGGQAELECVTLDWETAYAKDYRLEGKNALADGWQPIFDSANAAHVKRRRSREEGQSPALKKPVPLHIIHTLDVTGLGPSSSAMVARNPSFRFLRLFIIKPARGWGVSLWQFDVLGRAL